MGSGLPGPIVVPYPITCPPAATAVNIYASDPLELSNSNSPHDTSYTITNGKYFKLQRIIMAAGKDPSEKGTMIELIYKDSTEHLVCRLFIDQTTSEMQFADLDKARDGTSMAGNGSYTMILRRTRLSSASQHIDVHVQGYVE